MFGAASNTGMITMNNNKIKIFTALVALQFVACSGAVDTPQREQATEKSTVQIPALTLATWNVEHLAYPAGSGCKPRTTADLEAMKAYVASLNADVVALQEVASVEAVNQLFPAQQWQIIMSDRPASEPYTCRENGNLSSLQKVGFAIRKSMTVQDSKNYADLALENPGLRYGLSVTLNTIHGQTEILNVHMKSGCFVDDYRESDRKSCQTYAQQAAWLDNWVEQKEASDTAYIVLGDFNHRLSVDGNVFMDQLEQNTNGEPSSLQHITQQLVSCHPRYPDPIDHVIIGGIKTQLPLNAKMQYFADQAEEAMLSDHCAVIFQFNQ